MNTIRHLYNQGAHAYIELVGSEIQEYEIASLNHFKELLPAGGRILDVGCGSGKHAQWFLNQGFAVSAVDISDEMVKYVQVHHPGVAIVRGTIGDIKETGFDGIWCLRVFHHIPFSEQEEFLSEIAHHLKPGGLLYITAVHDNRNYEAHDSINGTLKKRITKTDFKEAMSKSGFTVMHDSEWGNGHAEYICKKT